MYVRYCHQQRAVKQEHGLILCGVFLGSVSNKIVVLAVSGTRGDDPGVLVVGVAFAGEADGLVEEGDIKGGVDADAGVGVDVVGAFKLEVLDVVRTGFCLSLGSSLSFLVIFLKSACNSSLNSLQALLVIAHGASHQSIPHQWLHKSIM